MNISLMILQLIVLFVSLAAHEFAHGWVARQLGDRTAEFQGRLTFNPKAHIDPLGTIILPLLLVVSRSPVVFGWAKPVPINPLNFRNPRKGMMWSALGGPMANFTLAAFGIVLFKVLTLAGFSPYLVMLSLLIAIQVNVFLGMFNLIPVPPLDGGRILVGLLPREQAYAYSKIEPYGFLIVIGLMYFNVLDRFLYYPITLILRFLGIS